MKSTIFFISIYIFFCINLFAQDNVTDTLNLKMKLIAIDSYKNYDLGGGQKKSFLLLLEIESKDMDKLEMDTIYCKNRIVAEYDAFTIDNLIEGEFYNFKLGIYKNQYGKLFFKNQKKAVGSPTSCIDMNLNRRWDRQYWIFNVAK